MLFLQLNVYAQSNSEQKYKFNLLIESGIAISSLGFGLSGHFLEKKIKPLSESQLANLNPQDVNAFDRAATKHFSLNTAKASDVLLYSSIAIPAIHLVSNRTKKDAMQLGVIGVETFLLNASLTYLVKNLTVRGRPFLYNPEAPLDLKQKADAFHSFYSGHTSTVSAMSFYYASTFHRYYPESPWRFAAWSAATTYSVSMAVLRYRAGKHYPTDLISGLIIGAGVGILVPLLHDTRLKINR